VHETAVAAKVGIGATSTLKVRERPARYTGNMVPLVMGLPQREKVQCFFCNRCYKAILPTWRGPSMAGTNNPAPFSLLPAGLLSIFDFSKAAFDWS
jgi:hypothetical protein